MAYHAWAADIDAGRDALLIAPTNDLVAELNERARLDRLRRHPQADNTRDRHPRATGLTASAGDWIATRNNARWLHLPGGGWVEKRSPLGHPRHRRRRLAHRVAAARIRHRTRPCDCPPTTSPPTPRSATPAPSTAPKESPPAPRSCHVVGSDRLTRQQLYVALTRGKAENHIYFSTAEADPHRILTPKATHPPTAVDILSAILRRDGAPGLRAHRRRRRHRPVHPASTAPPTCTPTPWPAAAEQLAGTATMTRIDAAATAVRADHHRRRRLAGAAPQPGPAGRRRPRPQPGPAPGRRHDRSGDAVDPAAVLDWRLAPPPDGPRRRRPAALAARHPRHPAPPTRNGAPTSGPRPTRRRTGRPDPRTRPRLDTGHRARMGAPTAGQQPGLLAEIAVFRAAHDVDAGRHPHHRPPTARHPLSGRPRTPATPASTPPCADGEHRRTTLAHPRRQHRPAHHHRPVLATAGHPPRPRRPRRRRRRPPGRRGAHPPRRAARRTARRRAVVAAGRHPRPAPPSTPADTRTPATVDDRTAPPARLAHRRNHHRRPGLARAGRRGRRL